MYPSGHRGRPGSSPRGRGKPRHQARRLPARGLIPARAGKTFAVVLPRVLATAHPRAGGENYCICGETRHASGSSPRGRGKLHSGIQASVEIRLIPARAGKTGPALFAGWRVAAHPRAGGENAVCSSSTRSTSGSSPRGRGKLCGRHVLARCHRLIPARAGKTSSGTGYCLVRAAHPRAGGENMNRSTSGQSAAGSSPRGRGKPNHANNTRNRARLIPARAGKTCVYARLGRGSTAHPRAGGENGCGMWV